MDVAGCALVLSAIKSEGSNNNNNNTYWPFTNGSPPQDTYSDIKILNGNLAMTNLGTFYFGIMQDDVTPVCANLTIVDSGHFLVEADVVNLGNAKTISVDQTQILVSSDGVFNIFSPNVNLYAGDIVVEANGIVNITTNIFNAPIPSSNINIHPRIILEGGSPEVYFIPIIPGATPVDAMPTTGRIYAENTFTFQSGTKGKFVFQNVGNAFELSALLSQNAISINGNNDPTYVRSKLNPNTFINGDLVLQLK